MNLGFHPGSEWWLLLLLLVPLAWLPRWRRRRAQLMHSSVESLNAAGSSWISKFRWLATVLRTLGLITLVVCIARPIKANERSQVSVEGVAIQSVIDRSGSMAAMDFIVEGGRVDRLTAVKKVLTGFVEGSDELDGRPNDLVGLVAFARHADTASPLTLDHAHVINALNSVSIATERSEDGTAIGDAVALAVERLRELEERGDVTGRKIKSKVIVLLTDGENNSGDISPETAAEIAAAFDVKLYAIGVGSDGAAPIQVKDAFGRVQHPPCLRSPLTKKHSLQWPTSTGGRYFRAADTEGLKPDLRGDRSTRKRPPLNIDAVQAVSRSCGSTDEHRWASASRHFSLVALLLLAAEQLLVHTRFRTLP